MNDSTRHNYYKELINETPDPAPYLQFNLPYKKLTLIAQARLNVTSFYHDKYIHKLNVDNICNLCSCREEESIYHILWNCRIYGGSRIWIRELEGRSNILNCNNISQAESVYKYMNEALKMRKMIIDEDNGTINSTNIHIN